LTESWTARVSGVRGNPRGAKEEQRKGVSPILLARREKKGKKGRRGGISFFKPTLYGMGTLRGEREKGEGGEREGGGGERGQALLDRGPFKDEHTVHQKKEGEGTGRQRRRGKEERGREKKKTKKPTQTNRGRKGGDREAEDKENRAIKKRENGGVKGKSRDVFFPRDLGKTRRRKGGERKGKKGKKGSP